MFDPAALLIKTIGLALPVEAANGPAGQQPGDGGDAAGNGGFAGLLALKLESVEPAIAGSNAPQVPTAASGSLVISIPQPIVPSDWAAKSLPATGNILPLPLPTALADALPAASKLVQKPTQAAAPAEITAAPELATQDPKSATLQTEPAAPAPSRRAAPRVAVAVAEVLAEAGAAIESAQEAPAPQVAIHSALPAATVKPRPATTHNAKPEAPEAADPEQNDAAKVEAELLPTVLVFADLMAPAPLAATVTVQAAEPATAGFTPAPAPANSGKALLAAAPALPAETAALLPQTAPAPATAAQVRVALRLPAEPASLESEVSPSSAPARSHEESSLEASLPASARAVAAPAALPLATPSPTHGHVSAHAPATVEVSADFTQIVDRLVAARDAIAPAEVRVTLDHAQFGKVSVGFTTDVSGMNVTLAAADPEFARAVEAAAPFAPPDAIEASHVTASSPARGSDLPSTLTGQQGQQSSRQQPTADPRGASAQANSSNRTPDSEARSARGRGIFA